MKSTEEKIAAIKQSIEAQTGKECKVNDDGLTISFHWYVKHLNEWVKSEISKGFLNRLPIGDKTDECADEPLTIDLIEKNGFKKLPYHLWADESDAYSNEDWNFGDDVILCRKGDTKDFALATSTDRGFAEITKPLNTLHEIRAAFNIVPVYFDFKGSPPTNI